MMKFLVKEVAQAKGFDNASQLGEAAKIPLASIYRIWNGTAKKIGIDVLERLCRTLNVQPGMLIMWIDEGGFKSGPVQKSEATHLPRRQARVRAPKSQARKAATLAASREEKVKQKQVSV